MQEEEGSFDDWELTSPSSRMEAPGRTVFFLTEFQISGMLEALRSDLVDRMSSFRLMEGTVSGDSLGNYRLALSVELSDVEGNHLVHQLAGWTELSPQTEQRLLLCGKRVLIQVQSMTTTRTCSVVVL